MVSCVLDPPRACIQYVQSAQWASQARTDQPTHQVDRLSPRSAIPSCGPWRSKESSHIRHPQPGCAGRCAYYQVRTLRGALISRRCDAGLTTTAHLAAANFGTTATSAVALGPAHAGSGGGVDVSLLKGRR